MMGFGRGWGMGYGMHGIFGGLFMIIFWALIIVGIIYLVKNYNRSGGNNKSSQDNVDQAINIARERYARGEINKEELEQIIQDLRQV